MHMRTHALGCLGERLKIDMCGQIHQTRCHQRIGEVMAADGLQGIAEAAPGMAIVENQRNTARFDNTPPDLEGNLVGPPFEYLSDFCVPYLSWEKVVEERYGVAIDAEAQLSVVAHLDDAFMPSVRAHHRLVDWQRVNEFVCKNDKR